MRTPFGATNNKYEISADIIQIPPPACPPPSIGDVIGLNDELNNRIHVNEKGAPSGVVPLGPDSKIPETYLPDAGGSCCTYKLPASLDLTTASIGRVMCLNDAGNVVVYQESPATDGVTAKYELSFNAFNYENGGVKHATCMFNVSLLEVGDRIYLMQSRAPYGANISVSLNVVASTDPIMITYSSNLATLAQEVSTKLQAHFQTMYGGTPFFFYPDSEGNVVIKVNPSAMASYQSNNCVLKISRYEVIKLDRGFTGGDFYYTTGSGANYLDNTPFLVLENYDRGWAVARTGWADRYMPPSNASSELSSLQNMLSQIDDFTEFLNISSLSGKLIIEEKYPMGFKLSTQGDSSYVKLTKIRSSELGFRKLPTKLPIGKLVGIEDGMALIENSYISTYKAKSAIVVDRPLYNLRNIMDISLFTKDKIDEVEAEAFVARYGNLFIFPTDNGLVRAFDVTTDIPLDKMKAGEGVSEPYIGLFNHALLGFPITGTDADLNIPVMNTQYLALLGVNLFQLYLSIYKYTERDFIVFYSLSNRHYMQMGDFLGKEYNNGSGPPTGTGTGSGSGSGSGYPPTGSGMPK